MKIARLLLAASLALPAQQTDDTFRFETTSRLVVVNVSVRDADGRPLENLKPGDFELLEDGKPQKISVFEFQRLEEPAAPAPPPASPSPERRTDITPSRPGEVRYKDRRLMVLFFDFSAMPPADQIRAQQAALKFLNERMSPSDLVAVMSFSTSLRVLQDFTSDRDLLTGLIRGFRIGETSELAAEAETGDEDSGLDTGDAFLADETEFNIFNTDRKLSALESAAKMLASLPEKKALVYFSSGVGKTGVENQSQLQATINAAVRGNISFYPVDARGLVAEAPAGDASQASPRGAGIFSGRAQRQRRSRFEDQQETLFSLASETGGKAFLDDNDLAMGIVQAQRDISSYYILGYYTTNPAQDGRFRRIQVRVASQTRAKLDFRSGYFAPKQFRDFTSDDKERQLEEALLLGDPMTDLPLALEVNWFRLTRDRYFVPVAVKIPGSAIELARQGGSDSTEMDFIGQVRDRHGKLLGVVRDNIKVKLRGEDAARLVKRHLQYDAGFTLEPGEYRLKFLARENETGKMGTFETGFVVPDIEAESSYLRLSSVVWAGQREPLSAAVGAARRDRKLLSRHPLISNGHKLVPSITRVFRKDQDLHVYFEVYDPAFGPQRKAPGIRASVSFLRGDRKAFETGAVSVASAKDGGRVPVQLEVPLSRLAPGRYTCQVNVVDQIGRKFAFRRAPVVVLP